MLNVGKAQSTRSAQAASKGAEKQGNDSRKTKNNTKNSNNSIGEVNQQMVSDCLRAGFAKNKRETMIEFDQLRTRMDERINKELTEMKEKLNQLESLSEVHEKLAATVRKMQKGNNKTPKDTCTMKNIDLQRQLYDRVRKFVRDNIYGNLKFAEENHMHGLSKALMERPECQVPVGIKKEDYETALRSCIKKSFSRLRHNSQTLVRRAYIGKCKNNRKVFQAFHVQLTDCRVIGCIIHRRLPK